MLTKMHNMRYGYRLKLLCLLVWAACSLPAAAQNFPTKPLRLIVPYPAGTTTDLLARMFAPRMSAILGQPVVVDNKGGASGSLGAQLVAAATPDGYTLMLGTSGIMAANEVLMPKLGYNPARDFAAVGGIAQNPQILTVGATSGIRSIPDLAAFLKSNPARANYGSTGVGGQPALAGAALAHALGVEASHVPYNSVGQALAGLVNGDVNFMFYGSFAILPLVKGGQLRPLATAGLSKSGLFPELKTMRELGFKDFFAASWFGLYVPQQTPRAVLNVLAEALRSALSDPQVSDRLIQAGFDRLALAPEALESFAERERVRMSEQVSRFVRPAR